MRMIAYIMAGALVFFGLVAMSLPAWADRECVLSGAFKSDAAMTLADIVARNDVPSEAMNVLSDDFFGHMTHEWDCGRLRAWFDFDEPGPWQKYEIVKTEPTSIHIAFPDTREPDMHLIFEGACYKIRFGERKYHEYFCAVEVKGAT